VRRFTRRSRNRRIAWLSALGITVVLVLLVVVAVFSPLLALKTIRVEGASLVKTADVQSALQSQLDTPLALVDSGAIRKELARFPLIQSYVTESVPPNTLVVHIVERAPIAVVPAGSGFAVVDPAGVVISKSDARPPTLPLIDVGTAGVKSKAFSAAVEVLLALPKSVLDQVDTVTAQTKDDVTFLLSGAGQKVVWGSAEHSEAKARALAGLIKNTSRSAAIEYDVSAPNAAVVRPS
jgi:cell division protein FtsQ